MDEHKHALEAVTFQNEMIAQHAAREVQILEREEK